MQANLFKILAIAAAFSTVQSAPVETAEGQVTQGQVNGTQANEAHTNGTQANKAHTNEAHVDDGVRALLQRLQKTHIMLSAASPKTNTKELSSQIQQICYREEAPHISTREREGDVFARSCREYSCYSDYQCIQWGCIECNLYFDACGDSYTRCY